MQDTQSFTKKIRGIIIGRFREDSVNRGSKDIPLPFAQTGYTCVERHSINPCVETGILSESVKTFPDVNPDILSQVFEILAAIGIRKTYTVYKLVVSLRQLKKICFGARFNPFSGITGIASGDNSHDTFRIPRPE